MNTYTILFICFLASSFAVQLWLSLRHSGHIGRHRSAVPEAFADQVPLADHQKAADYSIAKGRIGRIELAWGTLLLLAWTLGGGLEILDSFWRTMETHVTSMMTYSQTPLRFWPHAVTTFVRYHNCMSSSLSPKTPTELLTGKKPDISNFRIFGCPVEAFLEKSDQSN